MRKKETPNIIIIVVDALSCKHLGCYGYHKPTTPNINRLAKDGVLFENCYSTTNATDPSVSSILSGKYPLSHGIIHHGDMVSQQEIARFSEETTMLPELLKASEYTTLAIDRLGRWYRKGFDYYSGSISKGSMGLVGRLGRAVLMRVPPALQSPIRDLYRRFFGSDDAKGVSEQAISLVKNNQNKNFLLFIHYWDTHSPYSAPRTYARFFQRESNGIEVKEMLNSIGNYKRREYLRKVVSREAKTTNEIVNRYDGCIAFVDSEIKRLLDALKHYVLLDNTLLILTSDHGESLTEHGIFFDHHGLYDESIHVPLIMRYPQKLPQGEVVNGFVQHIDLVPTILDVLNIETGEDLDGTSLLPLVDGKRKELRSAIYAEEAHTQRKGCLRTNDYKYILAINENNAKCRYCNKIHGGVEELYNLNADPHELLNVVKDKPEIAQELKNRLFKLRRILRTKKEKSLIHKRIERVKSSAKIWGAQMFLSSPLLTDFRYTQFA